MIGRHLFISAHCDWCHITIGVNTLAEGPLVCPSCGREMTAASGSPLSGLISILSCPRCGTTFVLPGSSAAHRRCPACENICPG